MISFKEYFLLREAKFAQSKKVIPVIKLPMFTVYLFKDDVDKVNGMYELKHIMENACIEARQIITKMGFPSMHSNVLIKDLSKEVNWVSGGGVGGYAYRKGKYMTVALDSINKPSYLLKAIVHEWAHLWMFNNSQGFKKAVKGYYDTLLTQYKTHFATSQKQKEKEPFKHITKYKSFDQTDLLLGRSYSDIIWREVVEKMMYLVRNVYQGYVTNKYDDPDSPWKEDEQTYFNAWRDNFKSSTRALISKIINDMSTKAQFWHVDMNIYKKQLNYLTNALTKLFYEKLINNIKRSVESDESDWKWAKEDGEDWVSKFPSISDYLYSETKHNENFTFANGDGYSTISNKFDELDQNRYGIVLMVINFVYNIFENTINQKNFPQSEDKLNGKEKSSYREEMRDLVKWVDAYGMSNDDELWATGVEEFLKLPPIHRKAILKLMGTQGERNIPNRRMKKDIKRRQRDYSNNYLLAEAKAEHKVYVRTPDDMLLGSGIKTIETATFSLPERFTNIPLYIQNEKRQIVGIITFSGSKRYHTLEEFEEDDNKHLVPPSSKFHFNNRIRTYGWIVSNVKKLHSSMQGEPFKSQFRLE